MKNKKRIKNINNDDRKPICNRQSQYAIQIAHKLFCEDCGKEVVIK